MAKPILISGIQPSGKLHLGNYLGALKNFVDLQNSGKYECYFFIADYHSLTEDFTPKEKTAQIKDLVASYLAAGLDPQKSTIFLQSEIGATTELMWILSSIAPFGELRRMTQFKEKANLKDDGSLETEANVGLFTYPILMSADIILYDALVVPVGDDQLQHLELARTLARKFNKRFGKTFTEPQSLLTTTPRLMSLDDPTRKMSKSRPEGCLFIDDYPAHLEEKIKHAVTDSGSEIKYDPENKAGISNLLLIMSALSGHSLEELEKKFNGQNYGEFKHALSDLVSDYFKDYRERKKAAIKDSELIKQTLKDGARKAASIATPKLSAIKDKLGLKI